MWDTSSSSNTRFRHRGGVIHGLILEHIGVFREYRFEV